MSRFSKPLLVFFLAIIILIVSGSLFSSSAAIGSLKYYGMAVTALILVIPALSGGIPVLKSDKDYLFTLPLKRMELAIALFIVQFLSFGFLILYLYSYMIPYLKNEYPYSIIVLVSLALSATSLGPMTYSFKAYQRLVLTILLALWAFVPVFGIPFSPSAIFTEAPVYAAIFSIMLAAITMVFAFRALTKVDFEVMRTITRYS